MKRIAIVGCPGSGKTTFARQLAQKTGLPILHLDFYYHDSEQDYYSNKEEWFARVRGLIKQDLWIMDGNYGSTMLERFKRADTVIFFDVSIWTSIHGVVKRRIQYRHKQRKDMPSDWKEKANWEFMKYVWNFRKENRAKILSLLEQSAGADIVVFQSRREANEYLRGTLVLS